MVLNFTYYKKTFVRISMNTTLDFRRSLVSHLYVPVHE